jgi:hypothetical protein
LFGSKHPGISDGSEQEMACGIDSAKGHVLRIGEIIA